MCARVRVCIPIFHFPSTFIPHLFFLCPAQVELLDAAAAEAAAAGTAQLARVALEAAGAPPQVEVGATQKVARLAAAKVKEVKGVAVSAAAAAGAVGGTVNRRPQHHAAGQARDHRRPYLRWTSWRTTPTPAV